MAFPLFMHFRRILKILTATVLLVGFATQIARAQQDETLQYDDEDLSGVIIARPSNAPAMTAPSVNVDRYCPGAGVYAEVCRRINSYRRHFGLNPLRLDARLNVAAQQWSDQMRSLKMTIRNFDHDPNWQARVNQQLAGSQSYAASENIAINPYGVQNTVDDWMTSPGHRANILLTGIKRIGVGNTGVYWVTDFSY